MATFADLFKKIVETAGEDSYPEDEICEESDMCMDCTATDDLNEEGLCPRCAQEHERGYRVQSLAGRCANGAERDHGRLFHAVPIGSQSALCGAKPGRTSAGWSDWGRDQEVTCSRCLRKLDGGLNG